MSLVSPTQVVNGTTADDGDVNTPINQVAAVINGGIDDSNIAPGAGINGSKLADGSVTFAKTSGIWWEELGRATLSSNADTMTIATITAKKYLRIELYVISTGGTVGTQIRFNNDSGANYATRSSANGGADGTATAQTSAQITGTAATAQFATLDVVNVATQEKLMTATVSESGTAGAANAPDRRVFAGKWANTANQITRLDVINSGAGDFASGSEVVVLGHN